MRNIMLVSFLSAVVMSCGLTELGEAPHSNADGVWTGPSASASASPVHISAFDYPDGYDWRSDPERGSVKCSLVLFAGKVPVLKIPVGDVYEVSSEPYRHRIISGHLYTDYADSSGTVIKKDGKELFRYLQPEEIACMAVSRGQVHTLGIPPDGGFSYRIDGEIVLERSSGRAFRHMVMDGGKACFCFSQPVVTADGIAERYYSSVGGKTSRVELDTLVNGVWDMTFDDGEVCSLVSLRGDPSARGECCMSLFLGDERSDLFRSPVDSMLTCSFSDQDCLTVTGMYADSMNAMIPYLWTRTTGPVRLAFDRSLAALLVNEGGLNYAVNAMDPYPGMIISSRVIARMPAGYAVTGYDTMAQSDSMTVCLGLSSRIGGRPILWKSTGQTDTLDVNGFIATVDASYPR